MYRHALLIFVAAFLIAAEEPKKDDGKKDDGKKDAEKMQGKWTVLKAIDDGNEIPEEAAKKMKVSIKGDKIVVEDDNCNKHSVTFKLDPAKKPKGMSVVPADGEFKGKTLKGIYELKGDDLKLCVAKPNKDTPKEFTSEADSGRYLLVLKRAK